MTLCQVSVEIWVHMEYLTETSSVTLRVPLNEVIYDFFDALKSQDKGYASLDF